MYDVQINGNILPKNRRNKENQMKNKKKKALTKIKTFLQIKTEKKPILTFTIKRFQHSHRIIDVEKNDSKES